MRDLLMKTADFFWKFLTPVALLFVGWVGNSVQNQLAEFRKANITQTVLIHEVKERVARVEQRIEDHIITVEPRQTIRRANQ
jgi:hypothetical protein